MTTTTTVAAELKAIVEGMTIAAAEKLNVESDSKTLKVGMKLRQFARQVARCAEQAEKLGV